MTKTRGNADDEQSCGFADLFGPIPISMACGTLIAGGAFLTLIFRSCAW